MIPVTRVGGLMALASTVAAIGALTLFNTPTAAAHGGNPDYRSVVHGITPHVPGVKVRVLDFDNRMQIFNTGGHQILIYGYSHDPYARLLPDGTVEVNTHSPAYWIDQERFGNVPVPSYAGVHAKPHWQVVDKAGEFDWHDHRMHWMSTSTPQQVTDKDKRTKIFDYSIPIRIDDQGKRITGTLYWVGLPGGSAPPWALISLGAVALIGLAIVVAIRRRRGQADDAEPDQPTGEAW